MGHCDHCGFDPEDHVELEVAEDYVASQLERQLRPRLEQAQRTLDQLKRMEKELADMPAAVRKLREDLRAQQRENHVQKQLRQDLEQRCSQLQAEVARLKVAAEEKKEDSPPAKAEEPEGRSRFSLLDVD